MYKVKNFQAEIPVLEYFEKYVDIPTFLECCKVCPNYDKTWSCPSYDFDVETYWKKHKTLFLTGRQMIFDEELVGRTCTQDELDKIVEDVVLKERSLLSEELFKLEETAPGSISLSAGSCSICGKGRCTRAGGEPCRFPDKMRYSIESLGGNVGKTISDLFHIELEWIEEGRLPAHFVLVCGLLK